MKIKSRKKLVIEDLPKQLRAIRDRLRKSHNRVNEASAQTLKKGAIPPTVVDDFAQSYIDAKEDEKSAKAIADTANDSIKRMAEQVGTEEVEDTGTRKVVQGNKYVAGYSIVTGQPVIDSAKAAKVLSSKELLSVSDLVIDKVKLENAITMGEISMKKAAKFLVNPKPIKRIYVHLKK